MIYHPATAAIIMIGEKSSSHTPISTKTKRKVGFEASRSAPAIEYGLPSAFARTRMNAADSKVWTIQRIIRPMARPIAVNAAIMAHGCTPSRNPAERTATPKSTPTKRAAIMKYATLRARFSLRRGTYRGRNPDFRKSHVA